MPRIQVLVAEVPRLLRDIVHEVILKEDDLEIVGEDPGLSMVVEALQKSRADVLILGSDHAEIPEIETRLLREFPQLRVLVVGREAKKLSVVELRPVQRVFEDISSEGLLAAIRGQAVPTSG